MDGIIYNIYSKLFEKNEKILIIVTGDHGMRDSGGHGGSSYSETHVPLLIIGHQCTNGSLFQTDIPANLAVLLGLNIPFTSIGQIRSNLLPVSLQKYLYALRYNNLMLLNQANLCQDHFLLATKFHEIYIKSNDEVYASKAIDFYKNCSNTVSEYLIQSSVKQDFSSLIIAILVMFNVLMILIKNLSIQSYDKLSFSIIEYVAYLVIVFMQFRLSVHIQSVTSIIVLICFLIKNAIPFIKIEGVYQTSENVLKVLILVSIIHPLTFVSSSFVEEEHQYWYFFNIALIIYIVLSKVRRIKNVFLFFSLLSTLRFLRTINSTGDKWASYPDFSDWLLHRHSQLYYNMFFIFGLFATFLMCLLLGSNKTKLNILSFIIVLCTFVLKSADYENVLLGKLIWFLILIHAISSYDRPKIFSWILISSLLLKPYNTVLISYCILASLSFFKIYQNITVITFCHFWLGNMLYFAQGHSNSLASVDISVGYIGLSKYQPLLVILQVLCHTYSLPVLCHFLVLHNNNVNSDKFWTILFCNRLYVTVITCIVTVIFRQHLFIWSVFAPKLFIESIHLIFLFVEISIYFSFNQCKSFVKLFKQENV